MAAAADLPVVIVKADTDVVMIVARARRGVVLRENLHRLSVGGLDGAVGHRRRRSRRGLAEGDSGLSGCQVALCEVENGVLVTWWVTGGDSDERAGHLFVCSIVLKGMAEE